MARSMSEGTAAAGPDSTITERLAHFSQTSCLGFEAPVDRYQVKQKEEMGQATGRPFWIWGLDSGLFGSPRWMEKRPTPFGHGSSARRSARRPDEPLPAEAISECILRDFAKAGEPGGVRARPLRNLTLAGDQKGR